MSDLRISALELAISSSHAVAAAEPRANTNAIVARATAFLAFLEGTTALTAPTPTASPLADADGSVPARLDDPAVVAETKKAEATVAAQTQAVVEHPTLTGTAASSTASGPVETPPAEPVANTAPPADTGSAIPPIAEVNAAIMAYNRINGREKTAALLAKYGGKKVPDVDPIQHAALLADAKAGAA